MVSESWREGSNARSLSNSVVNEESMRPEGHFRGLDQCCDFPSLLRHWSLGDRKGVQSLKTCVIYLQMFSSRTSGRRKPTGTGSPR